jgi:FtsP/CotA-like multicopper oxidase with cupredoxin domain
MTQTHQSRYANDISTGPVPVADRKQRNRSMKSKQSLRRRMVPLAVAAAALLAGASASAAVFVQCGPNNTYVDGDGKIAIPAVQPPGSPKVECRHLVAGDGLISMADGRTLYSFGFADATQKKASEIGLDPLAANFAAPTIEVTEGNDFYLSLTNVSMALRPDLFDPHTVHFHGFPEQPPVFDGMPEGSFGVNMGSTVTYFYRLNDPGTYMYHCHQEATEHMQMGMLGNLYVKPIQDNNAALKALGISRPLASKPFAGFVYNDNDGSTGYDVSKPLQLGSMDHVFHEKHLGVQPLPFKDMKDTYPMINGRGYPDTVLPEPLPPPPDKVDFLGNQGITEVESSQPIDSLVTAKKGERILLRLTNLNVTNYYTITAQGLPMKVVGAGARHLRSRVTDKSNVKVDLYYETSSVTLGGGESAEVLIDTTDVAAGTYFLYTTNLNYLSNFEQDNGGMMTEIVINQ